MPLSNLALYRVESPVVVGNALEEIKNQNGVIYLYPQSSALYGEQFETDAIPFAFALINGLNIQEKKIFLIVKSPLLPLPSNMFGQYSVDGGVRMRFLLQGSWTLIGKKEWQLQATLPKQCLQWQRRKHPRFNLPVGIYYRASFMFGRQRCELDIENISIGGVALRGNRKETAMLFLGRKLSKVMLHMADGKTLQVSLRVCTHRRYESFLLGEQFIVGCALDNFLEEDFLKI